MFSLGTVSVFHFAKTAVFWFINLISERERVLPAGLLQLRIRATVCKSVGGGVVGGQGGGKGLSPFLDLFTYGFGP